MPDSLSTAFAPGAIPASAPASATTRAHLLPARQQRTLVRGAGLLACFDSLAAAVAILAVLIAVNLPNMSGGVERFLSARVSVKNILLLMFLAAAWPLVFRLFGLYDTRRLRRLRSEVSRLIAATTTGSAAALVFPLTTVSGAIAVGNLQHFWVAALALGLLVRTGRRTAERLGYRHARRIIIVGTGRLAGRVYRDIREEGPYRYELVGFVDEPNGGLADDRVPMRTIGTLAQLEQILMRKVIDEVIIALPVKSCYQQIQSAIRVCERAGVEAKYGTDLFESTVAFPRYDTDGNRAFVAMQVVPDARRLALKRAIDIAGAAAGLVLLTPLMMIVAIAIKLSSPGPVIYAQDRCGFNKRRLRMYKFRSMYVDAEKQQRSLEVRNEANGPVFKIRNDPRITPLGQLLRKSSLDELPQLWNVLRGDMSLVGPRPLPWRDVHRIERPSDMRRFSMRPGLTCLWQVQGRSNLDFERWVELDLEYIDNWSLILDCRILAKTIPAVLSGRGAA